MARKIKDTEMEKLAADRRHTGRKEEPKSMQEWLETEIWPRIPKEERGKPLTKEEVEDILGFGPEGV